MAKSACDCCDGSCAPGAEVECVSVKNTRLDCSFYDEDGNPKTSMIETYEDTHTKTTTKSIKTVVDPETQEETKECETAEVCSETTITETVTHSNGKTSTSSITYAADCTVTHDWDCGGSYNYSGPYLIDPATGQPQGTLTISGSWSRQDEECVWEGTYAWSLGGESGSGPADEPLGGGTASDGVVDPPPVQYSKVYAGDGVFSDWTTATYPPWPEDREEDFEFENGQGSSCTASRKKTEKTSIKYRIKHFPTISCYLKLWLLKKVTDKDGNETKTHPTKTWSGSGSPCFEKKTKPPGDESNREITSVSEISGDALELDSSAVVTLSKYSCLSDYIPADPEDNDPEKPNGFPNPAAELEAP
jgi:hypothetical protein